MEYHPNFTAWSGRHRVIQIPANISFQIPDNPQLQPVQQYNNSVVEWYNSKEVQTTDTVEGVWTSDGIKVELRNRRK